MDSIFYKFPYKRPIDNEPSGIVATFTRQEGITLKDQYTGIEVPFIMSYMTEEIMESMPDSIQVQNHTPVITSEMSQKQVQYINIKQHCIRVAENLNDNLRSFLSRYYKVNGYEGRKELFSKDFNTLRDILSRIVKKDTAIHTIDLLATPEKRKLYTSIFSNFIKDRNIYTHGNLHIRTNDDAIVIAYISKEKNKEVSCVVDKDIFQSFLWVYSQLNFVISQMNEINNTRGKEKGITNFV